MGKSKKLRKLMKSAKCGNSWAMYQLGICYETGRMTEQDMTKAADWMRCAANGGCFQAVEWIKDYMFDDDAGVQAES